MALSSDSISHLPFTELKLRSDELAVLCEALVHPEGLNHLTALDLYGEQQPLCRAMIEVVVGVWI